MIQVKEFVDTDNSYAENKANEFLAGLQEEQIVNICYGSIVKSSRDGAEHQRSTILIVYKTNERQQLEYLLLVFIYCLNAKHYDRCVLLCIQLKSNELETKRTFPITGKVLFVMSVVMQLQSSYITSEGTDKPSPAATRCPKSGSALQKCLI